MMIIDFVAFICLLALSEKLGFVQIDEHVTNTKDDEH